MIITDTILPIVRLINPNFKFNAINEKIINPNLEEIIILLASAINPFPLIRALK